MNPIRRFETALGEALDPDLLAKFYLIPNSRLTETAERYCDEVQTLDYSAELSPRIPGELRPFLTSLVQRPYKDDQDARGAPAESPADIEDRLKHLLLYAHGIVASDPLFVALQTTLLQGQTARHRARVYECLELVSYLREVIDEGIVDVIPSSSAQNPTGWSPVEGEGDLWQRDEDGRDWTTDRSGARIEVSGPMAREWLAARHQVSITVAAAESANGGFDLFCPASYYLDVAQRMFPTSKIPVSPAQLENHVLEHLLDMTVPRITDITIADVVAVRQSEETFLLWRRALRRALLDSAPAAGALDPENDQLRLLAEELRAAKITIDLAVRRSRSLNARRVGALRFAAGLAIDVISDPREVVADGLHQLADVALGVHDCGRASYAAFLRHYALFEASEVTTKTRHRPLTSRHGPFRQAKRRARDQSGLIARAVRRKERLVS